MRMFWIALLAVGFFFAYRTAMRAARIRNSAGLREGSDFLPPVVPFEDTLGSSGQMSFGKKSDFDEALSASDRLNPGSVAEGPIGPT